MFGRVVRFHSFPEDKIRLAVREDQYDRRYIQGITYFNECDFYEAHEVWEDLWADEQGPSRRFFQGLIQVAVCLHHFGNGNIRGAKKLYLGCRGYLEEYRPVHEGLDVQQLLDDLETCCAKILKSTDEFPQIDLDVESIPEIHLQPPATRCNGGTSNAD